MVKKRLFLKKTFSVLAAHCGILTPDCCFSAKDQRFCHVPLTVLTLFTFPLGCTKKKKSHSVIAGPTRLE